MDYSFFCFLGRGGFHETGVVSVMETIWRPPIWSPLIADWKFNLNWGQNLILLKKLTILPGPRPLTATLTDLIPRSITFDAMEIAVACAAMLVPFLVFLKPSIPQDLKICTSPFEFVKFRIVLFGDVLMLIMGISLKGMP